MFHHVGLSWMIATKEQYYFSVDKHHGELCAGGPCFNETVYQNLHGHLFEEFFVTELQYRYDIMCVLYAYKKCKDISTGATYFHGGRPLP